MKKNFTMLVLAASLAACGGSNSTANLAGTALPDSTVVTTTATESMDSAQFVADAYRDGQNEIRLSQTALQRASDSSVKKFAQAMIDHHTAMNKQLAALAQAKGFTLPTDATADQDANAAMLANASAADFDRVYMQLNVAVHDKDVAAFRQQAKQGNDADVRKLADASLPLLKLHLAAAEDINGAIDPNAFLAQAYQDGLAEIQLGQLALQRATNADVKAFAQRMVDDHTRANSQIATLAQQAGVTLPSSPGTEQQSTANELSALSGADFDKAYMDVNVIAHLKDVRAFRHQSEEGKSEPVKSFAQQTLPVLSEHLAQAHAIDKSLQPSFLFSAYQDGKAEIAISNLAMLKSSNADVRAFAQRMLDDHGKANNQIATLTGQKNVGLTSELAPKQALAFVALSVLSGSEFDKAYADYNVNAHEKDVTEFTEQSQQASDADIRQFAQATLAVLQQHLAQAQSLKQSTGANAGNGLSSSTTGSASTTQDPVAQAAAQ